MPESSAVLGTVDQPRVAGAMKIAATEKSLERLIKVADLPRSRGRQQKCICCPC